MVEKKIHDQDGKPLYSIHVAEDFTGLPSVLQSICPEKRKLCIITDSTVDQIYRKELFDLLMKEGYPCFIFSFPAGEASKNLSVVEKLYQYLIQSFFDRKDILIALGGGVTGDLTGFTAATYLRGIRFLQLPTTLLSMVDSSIGGKTGVDFQGYKNMVGAFYQPSAVYMNISTLKTLPKREFSAGMGEVIKHGLIKEKPYFDFLFDNAQRIQELESSALTEMIVQSLSIKGSVVERDPKERGERALLNFGHTLGHAIENLSHFSLLHGECVALGSLISIDISTERGTISKEEQTKMVELYRRYSLPTECNLPTTMKEILSVCHHDKKADGERITFVLLQKPGCAVLTKDVSDQEIAVSTARYVKMKEI